MRQKILEESLLLLLAVLVILKILYHFRHLSFIGDYLATWAAILLIYVPIFHMTLRRSGRRDLFLFFEKKSAALGKNLLFSLFISLIVFPLFLVANHFYQKIFFGFSLDPALPHPLGTILTTQLLLVALPEEFFFRGYLQELLTERFHKKVTLAGLSLSHGALLTSLLFAFSHSLITLQWWHFAIFFPGLVFGWLREKTGTITASIFFHATSNLVIAWVGKSYH